MYMLQLSITFVKIKNKKFGPFFDILYSASTQLQKMRAANLATRTFYMV